MLQKRLVTALVGILYSVTSALGQTLRLTSAAGKVGESITVQVALQSSSADIQPAALQWEARIPSIELQRQGGPPEWSVQPAKHSGKSLTCISTGNLAENLILRCVMAGGDKTIPSGAVGRLTFRISEQAPAGKAQIRLEHVLAVTRDLKQFPLPDAVAVLTIRGRSQGSDRSHPPRSR